MGLLWDKLKKLKTRFLFLSIEGSTIKETLMRSVVEAVGEDLFENEILTKLMEEEDSTVVLQKGFVKSHFSNQHKYYQFQ